MTTHPFAVFCRSVDLLVVGVDFRRVRSEIIIRTFRMPINFGSLSYTSASVALIVYCSNLMTRSSSTRVTKKTGQSCCSTDIRGKLSTTWIKRDHLRPEHENSRIGSNLELTYRLHLMAAVLILPSSKTAKRYSTT